MLQVKPMTEKEKVKMYMKLSKKELVRLLMNNQELAYAAMQRIPLQPGEYRIDCNDSTGNQVVNSHWTQSEAFQAKA